MVLLGRYCLLFMVLFAVPSVCLGVCLFSSHGVFDSFVMFSYTGFEFVGCACRRL